MSNAAEILFLRLWTKAVGTKDYDKEEWKELQRFIEKEVYKPDPLAAFQAGPVLLREGDKCAHCEGGVLNHIPYRGPSALRCMKCGRVPQEPPKQLSCTQCPNEKLVKGKDGQARYWVCELEDARRKEACSEVAIIPLSRGGVPPDWCPLKEKP